MGSGSIQEISQSKSREATPFRSLIKDKICNPTKTGDSDQYPLPSSEQSPGQSGVEISLSLFETVSVSLSPAPSSFLPVLAGDSCDLCWRIDQIK